MLTTDGDTNGRKDVDISFSSPRYGNHDPGWMRRWENEDNALCSAFGQRTTTGALQISIQGSELAPTYHVAETTSSQRGSQPEK